MGVFLKKHRMAFTLPGCCAALTLLYMAAFSGVSAEGVRDALLRYGDLAPVIYMLLFYVLPAFFFPVAVLAFAGGLLFGLLWGSVYTFIGAVINCALMFFLARRIGREKIRALVQRKLPSVWQARLKKAGGRKGFLLIILRLIPAVPYNLINYAFGLTEMPFAAYVLGSAIGIIPGTLIFINIGDKALDVTSPSFWIALGLLVLLLLVVTAFMSKKLFPNNDKDTNGEVTEYGKDK